MAQVSLHWMALTPLRMGRSLASAKFIVAWLLASGAALRHATAIFQSFKPRQGLEGSTGMVKVKVGII